MANFDGVTVSNGIQMLDTDGLKQLLARYDFGDVQPEFQNDGSFGFWGYDWFDVYQMDENGDPADNDGALEEFLDALRQFVPEGDALVIECVGHEKLRYVAAWQVEVRRDEVRYSSL